MAKCMLYPNIWYEIVQYVHQNNLLLIYNEVDRYIANDKYHRIYQCNILQYNKIANRYNRDYIISLYKFFSKGYITNDEDTHIMRIKEYHRDYLLDILCGIDNINLCGIDNINPQKKILGEILDIACFLNDEILYCDIRYSLDYPLPDNCFYDKCNHDNLRLLSELGYIYSSSKTRDSIFNIILFDHFKDVDNNEIFIYCIESACKYNKKDVIKYIIDYFKNDIFFSNEKDRLCRLCDKPFIDHIN